MKYAHMNPDEMVQAYRDLGEPYTIPTHFDVFKLTDEGMGEALIELEKAKRFYGIGDKIKVLNVGEYWLIP